MAGPASAGRYFAALVTFAFVFVAAALPLAGQAQTASASQESEGDTVQSDADPTRPVVFSLRPEFHTLADDAEQRVLIVRYDAAVLKTRRFFGGLPGVILRFEAPVVATDVKRQHAFGMGDTYGQFLVIPYATQKFAWVFGSGAVLPTGTDTLTGVGKWVVAPMAIPLWRLPQGLFYIKIQNFTSIAGDASRRDLNYLLVTPLFLQIVGRNWWMLADSEVKTTWTDGGGTNGKSGFALGRRIAPGVSLAVKPEVCWGPNPDGRWNLKFGIFWYRGRLAPPAEAAP